MKLDMHGIYKAFGANEVLRSVDFSLGEGEICALLGENGAGKSTLMNILGGVLQPDKGDIFIDGKKCAFRTPSQSLDAGIAFIHQELNLINDLAIYENMFIGREIKNKYGLLDHKAMIAQTQEVFDRMELQMDPRTMVRDLDASYKQIIEITRALLMNARLIIMDEPTTSLTDPEIEHVFGILRTLREQNVGIVFISHKLREVMEICDRYTVLRDGVMVSEGNVCDVTSSDLARFMVGHDVRSDSLSREAEYGNEALVLENLTHEPHFRGISLKAYSGEVLGVTGLLGDGRSELFRTVFGAEGKYVGKIIVDGKPENIRSTKQAIALGMAYVPRNRKENGLVKDMSILENGTIVSWPRLVKNLLIDHKAQTEEFNAQKQALHIKMGNNSDLITSLSGGNQQKVVLAKWLGESPKVLILDNPTQGVDVGAKEEIYDIILDLAKQGVAVIVLSSEAQEIIRVCNRALVMFHGSVVGEVSGESMTEHEIMRLATGG